MWGSNPFLANGHKPLIFNNIFVFPGPFLKGLKKSLLWRCPYKVHFTNFLLNMVYRNYFLTLTVFSFILNDFLIDAIN